MKLVPAFAADPARLAAAYHAFVASPRAADFQLDSWLTVFKPPENDWESIARVVIAGSGDYAGYLSARVDRDARRVMQLAAVRFDLDSGLDVAWASTLRTWMLGLRDQFEVIHWTARRGSHNAEMWTRAAVGLGGRVVGYQSRAGRLPTGELVDLDLFEVPGRGGRGAPALPLPEALGPRDMIDAIAQGLPLALGALHPAEARIWARELSEELARFAESEPG